MKADTNFSSTAHSLAGSFRRFGKDGVVYEVLKELSPTSALIRVLETGEEVEYPISGILNDPVE